MNISGSISEITKNWFTGRRGRDLRESLTAYLMLAPALLLIFIFGIFPVGFAVYVSLHKWLIIQGEFRGMTNYLNAIDNLAYLSGFALGLLALVGCFLVTRKLYQNLKGQPAKYWLQLIPGALFAASGFLFLRWIYYELPEFLNIAAKMRGLERTRELFIRLLNEAFYAESVYPHWQQFLWVMLVAIIVGLLARFVWPKEGQLPLQWRFTGAWLQFFAGVGMLTFTYRSVNLAYEAAIETGEDPGIWPQLIMITTGLILLAAAWYLWQNATTREGVLPFVFKIVAAVMLMMAAVILIIEIPTVVAAGDEDLWNGLKVTVFFSFGTVPIQLTIALFLSVLLFQKLKGSELLRIIYFLPYVTPSVAAATVFILLFSDRASSPMNRMMGWFGMEPQLWLREADGIFSIWAEKLGVVNYPLNLLPEWLPPDFSALLADWLVGPSQALVVIIMMSVWTFVGYNVVIYLAGLGNIPSEMTEAAEIDGASKWDVFRHITFPLLSPTTYFLSLIAVMGTFKAFNTIWVMRLGQALGSTDTISIVIFEEFFLKTRYGYASALSFVLFGIIFILTIVNNRIQGSRVFYG